MSECRNSYCNVRTHPGVTCYWAAQGKTADSPRLTGGRTYTVTEGRYKGIFCDECCNGDRCDDPSHFDRQSCPYCFGSGKIADLPDRTLQMK